ncbi:major facilitator transporter [Caballeronia fortuita]|uniref:Major facilitator transporter n=1 Tax=Caballeronia fortuita TaxID=1777138 RepID=A0A158C7H7_9BURK|nr:MFS transporter [Caballeronia fortuita]SAK78221.1 major facilitator transporter [Caballeronia fortuita]
MNSLDGYRPRAAWMTTLLLTGLALINFLDKIVLGMVAVPLMRELNLSPAQFGVVAGSFFWLFAVSTVLVGFLSNRVQTRWLLLAMGVMWAVLQVPQALFGSMSAFLLCRVVLGAAEGPFYPVSVHALYKWFPDEKRNMPVALLNQGAIVGLLLAGLLIPVITHRWGWRMNFIVLGVIGAVWSVLWLCVGREGNLAQRARTQSGNTVVRSVPYRKLLSSPSVLSVFILGFAAYWMMGANMTWLPSYLEKALGFSGITSGRCFALVIVTAAPFSLGLSWLSQRMLARGATSRAARVRLLCVAFAAGACLFSALMLPGLSPAQKVAVFAVAGALPSVCFALAPALLSEIVPDAQRGALIGIHTALASTGAAIAPMLIGRIVQTYGGSSARAYELGFATSAAMLVLAALVALRWLHPESARRASDEPVAAGAA